MIKWVRLKYMASLALQLWYITVNNYLPSIMIIVVRTVNASKIGVTTLHHKGDFYDGCLNAEVVSTRLAAGISSPMIPYINHMWVKLEGSMCAKNEGCVLDRSRHLSSLSILL